MNLKYTPIAPLIKDHILTFSVTRVPVRNAQSFLVWLDEHNIFHLAFHCELSPEP